MPLKLATYSRENVPPLYSDGIIAVENAVGGELGWSEVAFAQPVASDTGTLYLIFQLPAGLEGIEEGHGPGFGYLSTNAGSCVFLSVDGDSWSRLETNFQLLVDPVYTDRLPGTVALKSMGQDNDEGQATEAILRIRKTELLSPYPNPFNPMATVAFNLKEAGSVDLSIYDLRGRKVTTLEGGHLESGHYKYQWLGESRQGQRVASGVYFAKLEANGIRMIQRMTLVK